MIGWLRRLRGTRLRVFAAVMVVCVASLGGVVAFAAHQAPAALVPPAPDFTLPQASGAGAGVSLRAFRGHPVLLNFFNTQCADCLDELPVLRQAVHAYQAEGIRVVGVATGGDTVASARAFVRAAHIPYAVGVDARQSVAWSYDVGARPTSFFINEAGRLQAEWVGPLDAGTVRDGMAQIGAIQCPSCTTLLQPSLVADQPAQRGAPAIAADAVYRPAAVAHPFALRDQHGTLITPEQLRGRVVALTFISALCKEQCPLVGKALTLVRNDLGKDASRLSIVAVSVEPELDSPGATAQFARDAGWPGGDWHYLTAPRPVLSRIWSAYGVDVEAPPPIFKPTTAIVHQAGLFLIDPAGRLRAYYDVPFLPSRVVTTIRALLEA